MDQTVIGASASAETQAATPYICSEWHPWCQGIDRAVGTADLAFDVVPPVARKQYVNLLRIDLADQCVSFYTTPKGGKYQTVGQTVTEFLASEPAVMVAINANFSWYDVDASGGNFSLMGLAISQGNIVCDPTRPAPPQTQEADVPDQRYAGAMAMAITLDNTVSFHVDTQDQPWNPPENTNTAIAGSPQPVGEGWPPQLHVAGPLLLVEDGFNQATPEEYPAEKVAGRTAVGLSADGRYLYLVTLDGLETAQWPYGGGFRDIAQWLIIAGACTGLNLDGGGSATMACRDSDNGPILMNIPYGDEESAGFQRAVGNFLGVVTQPLS